MQINKLCVQLMFLIYINQLRKNQLINYYQPIISLQIVGRVRKIKTKINSLSKYICYG